MQVRVPTARSCAKVPGVRRGFSIVELLVVMTVLMTLLALALPAVTRVRATARKTTCINHLRNVALALTQFEGTQQRLPASGNYGHDAQMHSERHHSWAVSILPWVEQLPLWDQLDVNQPIDDPVNDAVRTAHVPVYVCPADISRSDERLSDLSYVVNAGIGFTVRHNNGVRDCPVTTNWTPIDLDGDGSACGGDQDLDDRDRDRFKYLGLFFLETWNTEISRRHYALADIKDGTTQTYLVCDNARTGYTPDSTDDLGFADPAPFRSSFFIGNPCGGPTCTAGSVDYSRCNAGDFQINSGLWKPEGSSPVPNSFHEGGVNMAFADAHVAFLSEAVDGVVHAGLASPLGILLDKTPLQQAIVSGGAP